MIQPTAQQDSQSCANEAGYGQRRVLRDRPLRLGGGSRRQLEQANLTPASRPGKGLSRL